MKSNDTIHNMTPYYANPCVAVSVSELSEARFLRQQK